MKHNGFTLIELLISCALLCLIIGITSTSFAWLDRSCVQGEINALSAACKSLQWQAIFEQESKKIVFDTKDHCYWVDDELIHLSKYARFGVLPQMKGPPSAPHTIINDPITFINHEICFTPSGIVQPGTIYMVNAQKSSAYALSCAVGHVSYLRKYGYQDGWHRLYE